MIYAVLMEPIVLLQDINGDYFREFEIPEDEDDEIIVDNELWSDEESYTEDSQEETESTDSDGWGTEIESDIESDVQRYLEEHNQEDNQEEVELIGGYTMSEIVSIIGVFPQQQIVDWMNNLPIRQLFLLTEELARMSRNFDWESVNWEEAFKDYRNQRNLKE